MKRIRIAKPKAWRERLCSEYLPLDPRDPDVRHAKALARNLSAQPRAVAV